jgi:hypothetical protein
VTPSERSRSGTQDPPYSPNDFVRRASPAMSHRAVSPQPQFRQPPNEVVRRVGWILSTTRSRRLAVLASHAVRLVTTVLYPRSPSSGSKLVLLALVAWNCSCLEPTICTVHHKSMRDGCFLEPSQHTHRDCWNRTYRGFQTTAWLGSRKQPSLIDLW